MLTTLWEAATGLTVPAALAVAAVLLMIESGTLVGMALPGTTLLVALGLWAHTDPHALAPAVAVAAAATVTGAHVGWWRGRTGRRLECTPDERHRRRLGTDERVVRRFGSGARARARAGTRWLAGRGPLATAALLACGHWAAAARPVLPRAAGAAGVPYGIAGPVLTVSGTAWATTLVLLGHHVGPHVHTHAGWAPVVVVVLLVGVLVLRARGYDRRHSSRGRRDSLD